MTKASEMQQIHRLRLSHEPVSQQVKEEICFNIRVLNANKIYNRNIASTLSVVTGIQNIPTIFTYRFKFGILEYFLVQLVQIRRIKTKYAM